MDADSPRMVWRLAPTEGYPDRWAYGPPVSLFQDLIWLVPSDSGWCITFLRLKRARATCLIYPGTLEEAQSFAEHVRQWFDRETT